MNYQMINFCHNLARLRNLKGDSYTKAAKALHISVKTLKLIENGIIPKHLSINIIQYASDYFNLPIVTLFLPSNEGNYLYL